MMLKSFTLLFSALTIASVLGAQTLDFSKIKDFEKQLDDVMEMTDTTEIKTKLKDVELKNEHDPSELSKVRLGLIYHEIAWDHSFFAKSPYKGYAKESYGALSELFKSPKTTPELMPFVAAFRASALSLVGAETKKLKIVDQAFTLFDDAVKKYAAVSYLPEYLRGSAAENLPWIFHRKKNLAKNDFQNIIEKQEKQADYANWKIMSFTYWAWAKQHQGKKDREKALAYLDKAIRLDPNYKAGRKKAEALKIKLKK